MIMADEQDNAKYSDFELMTMRELAKMAKISTKQVRRAVNRLELPHPVSVGERTKRWIRSEVIEALLRTRPNSDDLPPNSNT
jgi:predicted DNA-binding transcriptional regulator AlpA